MPELPSGTVTFFFSDIEGSTKLLHDLGAEYSEALAEHRDIMRAAFAEHAGVEVDTQGDVAWAEGEALSLEQAAERAADSLRGATEG